MTGAAAAWDQAAEGWSRSTPLIHAWLRTATAAMVAEARLRPGARVMDLAAGAGDQTKDFAAAVGPSGTVLATDISPRILDFARRNIQAAGLTNVDFAIADAEQPIDAAAPFDAVLCRLGLMFCLDPAAALVAARDALQPGGRFVALVFGEAVNNPCIAIMMKVARRHRGLDADAPPSPPGGLFSLGAPGRMSGLLAAAGYVEVGVESIAAPFELPDVRRYVAFVRDSGSPIMQLLAPLDAAAQDAAWREMEARSTGSPSTADGVGPTNCFCVRRRGLAPLHQPCQTMNASPKSTTLIDLTDLQSSHFLNGLR